MVGRSKGSIVLYFIVGLAVIGLVASLIKNPSGFLISILVMVGIAFLVFVLLRAVLNRRSPGSSD
jgi:Ca2+/Na+ antiporter